MLKKVKGYARHSARQDAGRFRVICKNVPAVIQNGTTWGDVLELISRKCAAFQIMGRKMYGLTQWDLLIAHPPCTYLSNAGARHLWKGHHLQADRVILGITARDFFMRFWLADIPRIAVENPVPSWVFAMPEYAQAIQPYQFGHPYAKERKHAGKSVLF